MEGNATTSSSTAESDQDSSVWECHICMQLPTDPVATSCGHIFCWPCIYQWLRNGPRPCPACRTHVSKDGNILPIYGGGARAGPSMSHGNGDRDTNNGDDSAVKIAASDHAIPPRPRNPLFFGAVHVVAARSEGSASTHEAEDSRSSLRDLALEVLQEKIALEFRVIALEQRNFDLSLEAEESTVRHLQHTLKLVQLIGRLRQRILREDHMLGRAADDPLPPGWSEQMIRCHQGGGME